MNKLSIFIFTRDLRLDDNIGLIKALGESSKVIPIFIFNKTQIDDKLNKYKSDNSVQFMCESLIDLDKQLKNVGSKLFMFYGDNKTIIRRLLESTKSDAVYITQDYSPFAKQRENDFKNICKECDVKFNFSEGHMLTGVSKVLKGDNTPYVKFTPYYNVAKNIKIGVVEKNKHKNYVSDKYKIEYEYKKDLKKFYKENDEIIVRGGREKAVQILKSLHDFKNYNIDRDVPSHNTTLLSAYLKFGCISVRELYHTTKKNLASTNKLVIQLYWRDFYMQVLYHHPRVINGPMKENYVIKWENKKSWFKKWCEGKTGIPMVDAGMRQMNKIGWMHNRSRMIVSNFLIKILRIDWRWGEKYFARKLVDYDVANNNGGWQWGSSTGTDSQPYFRVFNPFRQSEKFDHDCEYIKKWIPELKNVPQKDIHNWIEKYKTYENIYIKPIVTDLNEEFKKTLKIYKDAHN